MRAALLPVIMAICLAFAILPPGETIEAQPTCAAETGFCITNPAFQEYYRLRGEFGTLGYPISREFLLEGFRVQFFQRVVLQMKDGNVQRLNILDSEIMPLTRANGSVFPPSNPSLASAAPDVGSPNYAEQTVAFIQSVAPDTYQGLPVQFFSTFNSAVPPSADVSPAIQTLLNLEIWGVPTSEPAFDPTNPGFVYQRFQRGIMHFRADCQCTGGILVGEYLKSVMTGQNLPPDLAEDMASSRFLYQWQPGAPGWMNRPLALASTDLTNAFTPELTGFAAPPPAPRPELPTPFPTPAPGEPTATPTPTSTPDTGPMVSIQLDDDDIDPGTLIRVTGIANDDKGVDWIELEASRRSDNGNDNSDNDNSENTNENDNADNDNSDNDNEDTGDPVLDEDRRFDCDEQTECANVWEFRPGQPGEYTLRVRARDTDGQERTASTELDVRDGATPTPGPTPTPSADNENGNANENANANANANDNDNENGNGNTNDNENGNTNTNDNGNANDNAT